MKYLIELDIEVDASDLLNPEYINGIAVALGCLPDNVVQKFCDEVVTKIQRSVIGYQNIRFVQAVANPLESDEGEVIESESLVDPNDPLNILIGDVMSIESDGGIVESIVFKDTDLMNGFKIADESRGGEIILINRSSNKDLYTIRYIDKDKKVKEKAWEANE